MEKAELFMSDFLREIANRVEEMEEWFFYARDYDYTEGITKFLEVAVENEIPMKWATDYWNELSRLYN